MNEDIMKTDEGMGGPMKREEAEELLEKFEHYRVFVDPKDFFSMLGNAMQKNSDDFQKAFEAKYYGTEVSDGE